MFTKNSVRQNILSRLKRLRELTGFEKQNLSLNQRMQCELRSRRGIWAAYMPLISEPNLSETYKIFAEQIQFAFPRVVGDEIQFFLSARDAKFQKGQHGIVEPSQHHALRVMASDLTGVIVPGVAFDSRGARLGRGKGYYDRFLKKCSVEKIGVCFQAQLLNEKLKTQTHDERIDRLVTENFSLDFSHLKNTAKNLSQGFDLSGFSERNFI